jgi:hypothetical protein
MLLQKETNGPLYFIVTTELSSSSVILRKFLIDTMTNHLSNSLYLIHRNVRTNILQLNQIVCCDQLAKPQLLSTQFNEMVLI